MEVSSHRMSVRDRVLDTLGLECESFIALGFAFMGTIAITAIFLATNGNMAVGALALSSILLLLVTFVRLDWSFYMFIAMVLAFDQHEIPGFRPLTYSIEFFKNLKENHFLPSFSIAVFNPLEVHLLLLMLVWFFALGVKKLKVQSPSVWGSALLFILWVIGAFVYGLKTGGDFLPALWEVRALFYFGILYFFVPQIIQTKEQVRGLFWVFIFAIAFKAFQGAFRFSQLGFSFGGFPTLTNHEDPVFIATLLILLFGLLLFKAQVAQRATLLLLLPFLCVGFFAGQRRAAYASAGIALITFVVLLSGKDRWALARAVLPLVGAVVLYCAAFWESESRLASPVRLIRSGLSNDKEVSGERFYSNIYREFEKYDLAATVRNSPITGIGFGKKYEKPIPLADIAFPLRDYIPHNEVLWVLVKMGGAGFFALCLFLDAFALKGASVFSRLNDPYLKAVCAVVITGIINQLVVSYYDLQLTYYRNMVFLGTMMGLLPTLDQCSQQHDGSTSQHRSQSERAVLPT